VCTAWHSALGILSGNYLTDREFRTSSFFESNPPSLLPRVVFVLVGLKRWWWFGGLFCPLVNHKPRDKHWANALNHLKDSPLALIREDADNVGKDRTSWGGGSLAGFGILN